MKITTRTLALFASSAIALAASTALAAEAPNAAPADAGVTLPDLIVTAQRREETVGKVPISMAVVSGDQLAAKSVSSLQDLTQAIPNVQIIQSGLTTQTFVRGIGSGSDPGFEQSVAQSVDGVSYGRAQLTRVPFFDIQRVELLRGPQSILFGKNSTAGAVSVITAEPQDHLAAGATANYTPIFSSLETSAYVTGPLAEGLSGRVAVRYLQEDGYLHNDTKNRDEPRRGEYAARGILRFDRIPGFVATLKGEYSRFDVQGRDLQVVADVATTVVPAGPLAGQPMTYATALNLAGLTGALPEARNDGHRVADPTEFDNTKFYNTSFTTVTDVGDSTLTTITAYLDYTRFNQLDLDFTAANILTGTTHEHYRQFSQEMRFATPASMPLSFIGGFYYEHNVLDYRDITGFGSALVNLGLGPVANLGVKRNFAQTSNSTSGFGQLTWRMTDRLRLIGGVRVTQDSKEASRRLLAIASQLNYDAPAITSPATIGILQAALGYSLDNVSGAGQNLAKSRDQTRFIPSVTVEFDAAPNVLIFGSYKEGYKGGGFDARGNNNRNFGFNDETVAAWDLGVRAKLLDGRASAGLTLYRDTYDNLQIAQFDGTVGFNVGNAGSTRAQGFEADARYAVAPGVTLSTALSYLDFKYLDFRRGNCAFGQVPNGDVVGGVALCDYTGLRGRYTPKWNASGSLIVDRPITNAVAFRGALDVSYKSSHNVHDSLDALGDVKGYTIIDLRLGVGGDRWDVALVGKNLSDETPLTFAGNVPFASRVRADTIYGAALRGRSVGIQASLRY